MKKERRAKGYWQGRNCRLWYHLLHKAVKYSARLFRSILEEEAVRKIFTSIYTGVTSLTFLSSLVAQHTAAHMHTRTTILHNLADSFTLTENSFSLCNPRESFLFSAELSYRPSSSASASSSASYIPLSPTTLHSPSSRELALPVSLFLSLIVHRIADTLYEPTSKCSFEPQHKSQVNRIVLRPRERTQNRSANRIDYKYRPVHGVGIFQRDKYSPSRLFVGKDYYRHWGANSKIVHEVIHAWDGWSKVALHACCRVGK